MSCSSSVFKDAYMALDASGQRKRDRFFTDTIEMYCVADMPAARKGTTVNARLFAYPGPVVLGVGETVPTAGASTISFKITKRVGEGGDDTEVPWPVGKYSCDLFVDGNREVSVPFTIEQPDCPLYPAVSGARCKGFYREGATCPAADQTIPCVCTAEGVWRCAR